MELPAKNGMTVEMKENAKELQEVVVTGYQVQRKADLTGAVAVMDMKGPISESDPNMLNSMQGKLAGVDIVTDAAPRRRFVKHPCAWYEYGECLRPAVCD